MSRKRSQAGPNAGAVQDVAAAAIADRVEAEVKRAQKVERKELKADTKEMEKDVAEATKADA